MMHSHSNNLSHQQHQSEDSSPHNIGMGWRNVTRPVKHANGNGQMESMENHLHKLYTHLVTPTNLCSLLIMVSVIDKGEVARVFRFLNIFLELSVVILSWMIADRSRSFSIAGVLLGLIVIAVLVPHAMIRKQYSSRMNTTNDHEIDNDEFFLSQRQGKFYCR